jgi:hypothetical protein
VVYFRIQGPTVFIEFADQMNSPSHIHTIYRDFTNEYGSQWITRRADGDRLSFMLSD